MPRPCERLCKRCKEWKHHSRFRNSTVSKKLYFSPICKDCEQKERNEKKNADRPLAIIRQRTAVAARRAGTSFQFFWEQMNYSALVERFRTELTSRCLSCGHKYLNERDIQIEHIEPPRDETDWARLHARNIRFLCGSCNRTKSNKQFHDWLDDQEGARLSNLSDRSTLPLGWNNVGQRLLFG
jgi:hypothetical protein